MDETFDADDIAWKKRLETEAVFEETRAQLISRCIRHREEGMSLAQIAALLNEEGIRTKTGLKWIGQNLNFLIKNPIPKKRTITQAEKKVEREENKDYGKTKTWDKDFRWAVKKYPCLTRWCALGSEWVKGLKKGLMSAMQGLSAFWTFIGENNLPDAPEVFLLYKTELPDFFKSVYKGERTRGIVRNVICVRNFLEWVLGKPEYCVEDDNGRLVTSNAFVNPIPKLDQKGLYNLTESVRSTLPYGYIEEIRKMIAEGPNFSDWKWAHNAMGLKMGTIKRTKNFLEGDELKVSPMWYRVPEELIDKDDPDCVWRIRTRLLKRRGRSISLKQVETFYELWSPVKFVALLVKLQLPLRTFQVRMLDSGEADTWRWQDGEWNKNMNPLASGTKREPYANGIFRRSSGLIDGDNQVLLHINTNKTADQSKAGAAKGYNVPWIVGGPIHQDPFYWLEKLRRWQEKYNPLQRLVKWSELDSRHFPPKTDMQLAQYPDTAFLFRLAENQKRPDFPPSMTDLDRPWFMCIKEFQQRLLQRGERLPNGSPIRLIPENQKASVSTTYFPLHSLRVSLITALVLDGEVPLAIVQKIAGHSRLIMTLYYTKIDAACRQNAIQAGTKKLNERADKTIMDWMVNAEIEQLRRNVVANSTESFMAAVPGVIGQRTPIGWMEMMDGWCLVGGNNSEVEIPGCHNGGPNLGSMTAPRYAPVVGGARNCPMCRWFITCAYYLPQLATRWNNVSYQSYEACERLILAEERFREIDDIRAAVLADDEPLEPDMVKTHKDAQRVLEDAVQKFEELTVTMAAITRLIERCRMQLAKADEGALISVGGLSEFEYAIEDVDSELLQVSGICESSINYQDLNPGKAVFRQSQILDAALMRDKQPPLFLSLTEEEQRQAGSLFMRRLALQANPESPDKGRFKVISLIDAKKSLREEFGEALDDALRLAVSDGAPNHTVPIKSFPQLADV
ncbi:VPA1269 family protein [Herbaspirillum robiniae]|uniref:gamma-mobile-trio integrase GmtZ n=1 Tax=Herbaspirillum robiniae TaxID=2014887 RepID=UPI0009A1B95F|nr:VPA1269 family protein [Herbaspirillum robiniae]